MYLKEIKAHGFKSFADNISIELTDGITGIVGPNGSGKSNVVDAVRWVLGEQSVKSLRGEGLMSDVIFSGSKSRKPLNVASVTLIFDNSDRYLPLDFNEVAIKRRIYKDGTNEYFLNGEQVRLKDITDILLDSGIAKESFNIISQGQIDEIISTKPYDRRIIFEEAAGVLKYKKRKEEALRKLARTQENLNRANDVISEIELTINPLREQKEKALEYISVKEELERLDIGLLAADISKMSLEYEENKRKIEILNSELVALSSSHTSGELKLTKQKEELELINNEIYKKQNELLEIIKEIEQINSQKQIITERQKYNVDDTKLHQNILLLKEQELSLENELASIKLIVENKQEEAKEINDELNKTLEKINEIKRTKVELDSELGKQLRINQSMSAKIDHLQDSIDNNSTLPSSVRAVLNNARLSGIHNALGNMIEVEERFSLAISVALGAASSYVVVDNEESAKSAIEYLKSNNLGRTTFLPINVIKPKGIDLQIHDLIKTMPGFIDLADKLVSYDNKYHNIISNQLGSTIVTTDINSANLISKKINNRYRIVTLQGEVVNIGGSITGGSIRTKNIINDKYELESTIKESRLVINVIKELENKINEIDYELQSFEDKYYLINKNSIELNEFINQKNNEFALTSNRLVSVKNELKGTENVLNNTVSKEEEEILEKYYGSLKVKSEIENNLNILNNNKNKLIAVLEEEEYKIKKDNSEFNRKNNELKHLEIELNRLDVKLDNFLHNLSENYNITYEKAYSDYSLDIAIDDARKRVSELKNRIKDIGPVNLTAPEEYDRLNERYTFLINGRDDLEKAKATLLDIINEMDEVMKEEFAKTFDIINKNFSTTFKELFRGGDASLKLTNPDDLLETGIEIVASPPGKKLTSISLLSGGEKTFTAISLLFAILKTRPVPFCILDEVEAALDEANVDSFGEYLRNLKEKTQFILITHKKTTMEYVDNLYGITMQESGVSKLVSVKLENIPQ